MTRTERQILAIDKWRDFGGKGSIIAATGFGSCSHYNRLFSKHIKY